MSEVAPKKNNSKTFAIIALLIALIAFASAQEALESTVSATDEFTGDGTTKNFTLSNTMILGSESVYLNGLKQNPSGGSYTTTITSINFTSSPPLGDEIGVTYVQN